MCVYIYSQNFYNVKRKHSIEYHSFPRTSHEHISFSPLIRKSHCISNQMKQCKHLLLELSARSLHSPFIQTYKQNPVGDSKFLSKFLSRYISWLVELCFVCKMYGNSMIFDEYYRCRVEKYLVAWDSTCWGHRYARPRDQWTTHRVTRPHLHICAVFACSHKLMQLFIWLALICM